MTERLWVVAPVYFDVDSFLVLRERIRAVVDGEVGLNVGVVRFVVLDDAAGSDPQVRRLGSLDDVLVIRAPFNLGHQRAIVFALRTIASEIHDPDIVVTLDSDGEDRPEDLPRLLATLVDGHDDGRRVVLARRTKRTTTLRFKVMYAGFSLLFRVLTGTFVRTGNYAAFRGRTIRQIGSHPYFDLCYSSTLHSLNLDVRLVPCPRGPRYAGHSRMGVPALVMHGLRMLMPFMDRIAVRALFLFSVTLVVGLGLTAGILAIRLFTSTAIPGWAMYVLVAGATLSLIAMANFVTLFAVMSQSRALSLTGLEQIGVDKAGTGSESTR